MTEEETLAQAEQAIAAMAKELEPHILVAVKTAGLSGPADIAAYDAAVTRACDADADLELTPEVLLAIALKVKTEVAHA